MLVVVFVLWQKFVVGIHKAAHTTMRIWVAGGARILIISRLGATHYCQARAALRGPPGAWARQLCFISKLQQKTFEFGHR